LTKQTIDNLQPGTLDGDSLFDTAQKINENFNEIYSHFGDGQTLDNGYVGLKNLNAGIIVSQGLNTYTTREITSTGASIQITNGTGATGDPTLDLSETGVIASGSAPTLFAEVGLTVDVHGRITAISTPTLLTEAQAQSANASQSAQTATTQATLATNAQADAVKLSVNAEDSQYTLSDGTTTGFSALHHAAKAAADVATIGTSLSQANQAKTDAETAKTAAETARDTAVTKAGEALQSASDASGHASTASGHVGTASNHVSTASGHASTAGQHKTDAETAKTAAENAKTAAESAKTAAETAFDSFDDIYLGEKSSAPTQDNDGDALSTGSLYFDTTANELKVYNGSAWQGGVTATGGFMTATNNLSDLNNVATSRTNLGLGTIATQASNSVAITGGSISGITDLALADGGTGASTASAARTNLGLHAVANTGAYGDLTGTPTIPTHLPISGGSAGVIPYQTGANTTAFSAVGTSGQMLVSGGTGAPTWVNTNTISSGGGIATQMKFS